MKPDDEGQSFRHYCRAMRNGLERDEDEERGETITGGGVRIHLIENLYILRIYQTIIR